MEIVNKIRWLRILFSLILIIVLVVLWKLFFNSTVYEPNIIESIEVVKSKDIMVKLDQHIWNISCSGKIEKENITGYAKNYYSLIPIVQTYESYIIYDHDQPVYEIVIQWLPRENKEGEKMSHKDVIYKYRNISQQGWEYVSSPVHLRREIRKYITSY